MGTKLVLDGAKVSRRFADYPFKALPRVFDCQVLAMSVDAISQANGADLLNIFAQSTGAPAATTSRAAQFALQQAKKLAQISESQIVSQVDSLAPQTGTLLNVFA